MGISLLCIVCIASAQKSDARYQKWSKQLLAQQSLDEKISFCKDFLNEDKTISRFHVYTELAQLYQDKRKLDSALYYLDKATHWGDHVKSSDFLSTSYSLKASFYAREYNDQEKADSLLKKAAKYLSNNRKSDAYKNYYHGHSDMAEMSGDYRTAIDYIDSVIIISEISGDTASYASYFNNKGLYYRLLPDYKTAADNFLKSIELKELMENPHELSITYFNLAACYYFAEQYEMAIKYGRKCIELAKNENDEYVELVGYIVLSPSLRKSDQFEPTTAITDRALELAIKLDDSLQIANVYKEKGWIFMEGHLDYTKAEEYFTNGYNLVKDTKHYSYIHICLHGLIESWLKQEKYAKAKQYFKQFEEVTEKVNSYAYKEKFHKSYTTFYEKTGKPKQALEHYKIYRNIMDSITNMNVRTKVTGLERRYETQKKELKIVRLTQEREQQAMRHNLLLLAAGVLMSLLLAGYWAFMKLRRQQRELVSTNRVKDRLFSIIAHDLKGMILPFQRSGKILKHHIEKGNYERTIELSGALEQNAERLSSTLNNMLDWSLEQMNGYQMRPEVISVNEQLLEIISGYEQQASLKNTTIKLIAGQETNALLDKGAFHVIFRNLISNALKYTRNGSINIEVRQENKNLICTIADTGVGMTKEQITSMFSLDNNKSTTGTHGEKGTGLGLNLVQRFVGLHDGVINVNSKPDNGTRFELIFPKTIKSTTKNT